MQSCGVRRPSVCLSVCKHFTKIAFSTRQMAGSRPNLHTMVPRGACIQDVLKVKVEVKGHVIRTLLWFHENRFFSQANGWIATKLDVLNLKVDVKLHAIRLWFHKNRFFSQANGCILTSLSLTSPTLCPPRFLPHSNPQMAVSLHCEFRHRSQYHGETVCQSVCYTVLSHVLSLHALILWSTITLSFQYKYQAARPNV